MAAAIDQAAHFTPRRAGLAVTCAALAVGALALNRQLIGVFYDDGLYAGIAVALAQGMGYVHPHLPGAPAAVHYPPLWPVLLAPLFAMFPLDPAALLGKILNLLLAAAGAGLIAWQAARTRLLGDDAPSWLAPVLVGAAAITIPVLAIQAVLFSEPLFGVLLVAAVILTDAPSPRLHAGVAAGLAGCAAALALLTRSIGVAAGAGVVLYLLVVRRAPWAHLAAAAAPVALAGLGWGLWLARHRGGLDPAMAMNYGSYFETVQAAGVGVFWPSLRDLPRPLGDLALNWLPAPFFYYAFGAAALGVGAYGVGHLLRRTAIAWMLVPYLAILAVWPFPGDRFIWSILAWLALIWAAGALALVRRWRLLRLPLAVLVGVMLVGWGGVQVRGFAHRWWGTAGSRVSENFRELLPALESLPRDAVLATDDEALVWLYARRTSVPFYVYTYRGRTSVRPTPAEHRAYLERQRVTHILMGGFGSGSDEELDALLGAYPRWLKVVRVWRGGRALFEVQHAS
ncbi:MAG: hypothetical protein AUG01_07840 [Candidatus Rokubacteria bacterium 13_1_20CM_2_69_58]|nr:MAG: hypothetical protein AUG01_07840 [Candidatus Rokubacteria bacterium 13_1_20CM_2_69_58]